MPCDGVTRAVTVEIKRAAFAAVGRAQRQRTIDALLCEIPGQRPHALALEARTPGVGLLH